MKEESGFVNLHGCFWLGMHILDNECGGDPELFIDRIRIDEKTNSFFFRRTKEPRDNRGAN